MLRLVVVPQEKITSEQKEALDRLWKECFSDVHQQYIEENFFARGFARLFAYIDLEIAGTLELYKRNIRFAEKEIILGGMGGVCVTEGMRRKGIATKMLYKGLEVLKKEKCDIACLNVDLTKNTQKLYEKVGFTLMDRKISYENSRGEIKRENGTMFIPVCSKETCDYVMNSTETFHYGKGYW